MSDEVNYFRGVWPDRHRAGMAVDNGDVEDFLDVTVDTKPLDAAAFGQIDDLDAAPWLAIRLDQPLIKRQPLKALITRLREPDKSEAVLD